MSMVLLTLILFGAIAYRTLGVDLYPKVEFPMITVISTLPAADPDSMETHVTDRIEEALSSLDSIERIHSTSAEGISHVMIEFDLKKNIDVAYQEVQAKLSAIQSELPHDIIGPIVQKFNIDEMPIATLIASSDLSIQELTKIVDKEIKPQLKRLFGIGELNIVGGRAPKVWLHVDPLKLESLDITLDDVQRAFQAEHIDLPAGRMETKSQEMVLKTKAELATAADFEQVVVAKRKGALIPFSAIGQVIEGLEEEHSISKLNGKRAVSLTIGKQSGCNTVDVAHAVKGEIAKMQEDLLARGVHLKLTQDASEHIERSVQNVRFHLLFGGALAVLIVFIFLRNVRSTFVCALALPTAVIGTFAFMGFLGFTQNVMTLLALSIAIGLLIDDAIVVQENIIRYVEKGHSPQEAASLGTRSIALAVFATTLSVVAVFVPVAFMKGIVGRFFYQFGMTVSIAMLLSMLVSFTLNPLFSARFLIEPKRGALYQRVERALLFLERGYARVLARCLKYKKSVLLLSVALFAATLFAAASLRFEFFPEVDRGEFTVLIKTPPGSSLQYTEMVVAEIETIVAKHPFVSSLYTSIGATHLQEANRAHIGVTMLPKKERTLSQKEAVAKVRSELSSFTKATITLSSGEDHGGGEGGYALQFEIRGPSLSTLQEITAAIIPRMEKLGGYADIGSSLEECKPQLSLTINRQMAADLNISAKQIATTLKTCIAGSDLLTLRKNGENRTVTLRLNDAARHNLQLLPHLKIRSEQGALIPLKALATLKEEKSPSHIKRTNRMRHVSVHANLTSSDKVLGSAVSEITALVQALPLPAGYKLHFGGEAEKMKKSFEHMFFALILAVVLVYMVLAAQFESLIHPFIIMLALPLSLIGAISALLICKMTMSIFTMIGIIMLMGLVTKNGILLVDCIRTRRKEEPLIDAILHSGRARLRPILMTSSALILGMLPVAIGRGSGSEADAPMAVAVIGGLITSTLLTLLIVPSAFALIESLRSKKHLAPILSKLLRRPRLPAQTTQP